MKEATGELNMAVIVAISVGILAAFFFGSVWPTINQNFNRTAQCNKAICDCKNAQDNNNMCTCKIGNNDDEFLCPFKG